MLTMIVACPNNHEIEGESPSTTIANRRPCPLCGSSDRRFIKALREELKASDDPYNTVVEDSAKGRKIEETCRLFFQRKISSPNPSNVSYEQIRDRIKSDFSDEQFSDLKDVATVTDNLAHGNGFGARNQLKKICERKGWTLPGNDIVKGTGINTLEDIQDFVAKVQKGETSPLQLNRHSDLFEGNLVWTRTCRKTYMRLCDEIQAFMNKKIQGLI